MESKKQVTVALSTAEAEYQALGTACRELSWLKILRRDMNLPYHPITLYCDSKSALSWAKE